MHLRNSCLLLLTICLSLLSVVRTASGQSPELSLQSDAFAANGPIPVTYACSGDNKSPALTWSGVPTGTKTVALIVRDPDAPMGSWVHWVLYNLPANVTELPADTLQLRHLRSAMQGVNDAGKSGYQGPCPPPGPVHHYHFRLYALDTELDLVETLRLVKSSKRLKAMCWHPLIWSVRSRDDAIA